MQTPIPDIKTRDQMIRYFDGYSEERMDELKETGKLRRPVVKSHLLELLNGEQTLTSEDLKTLFKRRGVLLKQMDESLYSVETDFGEGVSFLEQIRPRIAVHYSTEKSQPLGTWVKHLVYRSPEIDNVWLSGPMFEVLWEQVIKLSKPHRFSQLNFTHNGVYDKEIESAEVPEEDDEENVGDEDTRIIEHRNTNFRLVDKVGEIEKKLKQLQELYSPFYAINQLRFPSPVGRGGHDFYENGKVTNKSQSFRDHRSHLLYVVRIYEKLLKNTEDKVWYSTESVDVPGQFRKMVGAPVVIRFQEPLKDSVFKYWIHLSFERKKDNRFRLWGQPIWLGKTKVHVYGVDRHLWRPISLELTSKGCIVIIPKSTCGNTVHRLVTNIQRFVDPGAKAFIGDAPYKAMVEESTEGISYERVE